MLFVAIFSIYLTLLPLIAEEDMASASIPRPRNCNLSCHSSVRRRNVRSGPLSLQSDRSMSCSTMNMRCAATGGPDVSQVRHYPESQYLRPTKALACPCKSANMEMGSLYYNQMRKRLSSFRCAYMVHFVDDGCF